MVRACMEGVAFSLRHNLEVAEKAGAQVKVLRAMADLPIPFSGPRLRQI